YQMSAQCFAEDNESILCSSRYYRNDGRYFFQFAVNGTNFAQPALTGSRIITSTLPTISTSSSSLVPTTTKRKVTKTTSSLVPTETVEIVKNSNGNIISNSNLVKFVSVVSGIVSFISNF